MSANQWTYLLLFGLASVVIVAVSYAVFFRYIKQQLNKRLLMMATLGTLSGFVFMMTFFFLGPLANGPMAIVFSMTMILLYLPYLYCYLKGTSVPREKT